MISKPNPWHEDHIRNALDDVLGETTIGGNTTRREVLAHELRATAAVEAVLALPIMMSEL